jgi:hypothetical protein
MRNEFSQITVKTLAARVGNHCSNPKCRRPTSGPQLSDSGSVNVGVAAHITAASQGGPRYDASLMPDERSSLENGIWLCQTCAKLIDSDIQRYTPELIRTWKCAAEDAAHQDLESRTPPAPPTVEFAPLYVHDQFNDHPPLRALADELDAKKFTSTWVPLKEAAAKRTLGYIERYFEGQEVRTKIDHRDHVWMVRSPEPGEPGT